MEVDTVSVPITRNEQVIKEVRELLRELQQDNNIKILATISRYEGLENIDSILRVADGIIIQKNDLFLDIGSEKIFIAQKEIIAKCNRVILLLVFTLTLPGFAKQENNARGLVSRQSLTEKNVRLDPLLRRALLRALTELEKEAQEKVRAEEARYARSEQQTINGNFDKSDEIQNTADSNYPSPTPNNLLSTPINEDSSEEDRYRESAEATSPATLKASFSYQSQSSEEEENTSVQVTKSLSPTVNPAEIVSNLISDDKDKSSVEKTETTDNREEEKKVDNESKTEGKKPSSNENEVDIFKAPLVAAFTLHQDSRGTPHSVIPLFRKEPQDNQRQQLLQQQFQLYQQQQQQQQQFLQNQFIPSVTITPLSQPNQFNQPQRFFSPGTVAPNFPSSTVFPPLVSNSILPQSFPSSVLPPQGFQASTTLAPFRTNHQNFLSTLAPPRNLSPQPFQSTLLPPQDFSVVQSHNFNFSPTPQPNFPAPTAAPSQGLQPISIPPVTLPLQNEPRFPSPIIVPSLHDQSFINHDQRLRNQFLLEEQNRQRLIEEQNRQRQIEEENKQKQIEEQNRQRQIEEQNRQRQIEEQRQRQQQLEELNRQRQIEEERNRLLLGQNLRAQRQEQGVDFQRSVGFSFNQNVQGPPKLSSNAFSFNIQPSQSFAAPINFGDVESRNRVNRQEAFGSTGNLGIVNNQAHRNFASAQNQFQSNQIFPSFQNPQEYRTIPDEHYRNLRLNQFQQANRFQQFRPNTFQQNSVQDVNKQLQKLLFQSGVATDVSGQEDLNIVSKVLALNHERSDTDVEETIIRNERRADDPSEKSLGVGEIKDVQVTTELTTE